MKLAADSAQLEAGYDPDTRAINGLLSISELDRRTRPYKRYFTIRSAVLADMGGEENTSEIQRQLISKFATLALTLEQQEAAALAGDEIDVDLFGRCAGHLRRIAEVLGLRRVPRDVPTLAEHLAKLTLEAEAAGNEAEDAA
jgi:hypothetical protein